MARELLSTARMRWVFPSGLLVIAVASGCSDTFSLLATDSPAPLTSAGSDDLFEIDIIDATTSIPLDRMRVLAYADDPDVTVGGEVSCDIIDANGDGQFGRHEVAKCHESPTNMGFGPGVVGKVFRIYVGRKDDPSETASSMSVGDAPWTPMN